MNADDLTRLWFDWDSREQLVRQVVSQQLAEAPPPRIDDCIVATYFLALRTKTLEEIGAEFIYHATSGIKKPPAGSLLEECTGTTAGVVRLDSHRASGPVAHGLSAQDAAQRPRLSDVVRLAPHGRRCDCVRCVREPGCHGWWRCRFPTMSCAHFLDRRTVPISCGSCTGFAADEPAFGTILKPTAGITPEQVGTLVEEAARCKLFLFVKEDENLYPNLDYSPVKQRTARAREAIERAARRAWRKRDPVCAAYHGQSARDPRDCGRRARGRCHGRHVQRNVQHGNRADGA